LLLWTFNFLLSKHYRSIYHRSCTGCVQGAVSESWMFISTTTTLSTNTC